jgi:hypothetical protein
MVPSEHAYEVEWLTGSAANHVDILPMVMFERDTTSADITHDIRGPSGERYYALCRLSVGGMTATLDYQPPEFRVINDQNGIEPGLVTLKFTSETRQEIEAVLWNHVRQSRGGPVEWRVVKRSRKDVGDSGAVAYAIQRRRPAQALFKDLLLRVYGYKCCITGCNVRAALEAAHIAPFADGGNEANRAKNGLLLRADLHCLFDAGLLGIDPDTLIVHTAPQAASWHEYASLNGKAKLGSPTLGFEWAKPGRDALLRRWQEFSGSL